MKLKGKTALITGGGGGIGRATCLALAQEGALVAVADISVKNAEKVCDEVKTLGITSIAVPVDLTNRSEVERMVASVLSQFGRLDLLINCAGWDKMEPFLESDEETWEKIIAINYKSVLYTTKATVPHMITQGSGKIVNVGSDAGRVGSSWEAVYSGTKGAIIAFSKSVAREFARYKINVNVVCPGLTDTPLLQALRSQSESNNKLINAITNATPFRRVGTSEEIAQAVLFLASPSSNFITGQVLSVSGGLTMG